MAGSEVFVIGAIRVRSNVLMNEVPSDAEVAGPPAAPVSVTYCWAMPVSPPSTS